jgi:hypothetical protein
VNVLPPLGPIRIFAGIFAIQLECRGALSSGETNGRPHRTTPSNQPAALGHCVARGAKNGLIGAGTVVSSLLIRIDNCYCRTVAYSRIIRLPEAALQPKRGGPGRPVEQRRLAIRVGDSGRGVIFRTPASMPVRDGHDTKSRGVAA